MTECLIGLNLLGLGPNAYMDYRRKEISLFITASYGVAGLVTQIALGQLGSGIMICLLPGAVSLLLSYVTKEQIGYGDGLLLLALGCNLTPVMMWEVCFGALALSGLWALYLLGIKHRSRRYEMAFVPFLLAAYILTQALQLVVWNYGS